MQRRVHVQVGDFLRGNGGGAPMTLNTLPPGCTRAQERHKRCDLDRRAHGLIRASFVPSAADPGTYRCTASSRAPASSVPHRPASEHHWAEGTITAFDERIEAELAPFRDAIEQPGLSETSAQILLAEISTHTRAQRECLEAALDPSQKRRPMAEACAGSWCLGCVAHYFEA